LSWASQAQAEARTTENQIQAHQIWHDERAKHLDTRFSVIEGALHEQKELLLRILDESRNE